MPGPVIRSVNELLLNLNGLNGRKIERTLNLLLLKLCCLLDLDSLKTGTIEAALTDS